MIQTVWMLAISALNIIGILVYLGKEFPLLPDQIAMHFDFYGEPSYYWTKYFIFMFPILVIVIPVLFCLLPKYDPMKENYYAFKMEYNLFSVAIQSFMVYVTVLLVMWNKGPHFDFLQLTLPGITAIFFVAGYAQIKCKRTKFFGVRTAWSLRNDKNWETVNKPSGYVFFVSGTLGLISTLTGNKWILAACIIVLIAGLIGVCIYGYNLSKREPAQSATEVKKEAEKPKTE